MFNIYVNSTQHKHGLAENFSSLIFAGILRDKSDFHKTESSSKYFLFKFENKKEVDERATVQEQNQKLYFNQTGRFC